MKYLVEYADLFGLPKSGFRASHRSGVVQYAMQRVFMPISGTLGSPFSSSLRLEAIACLTGDHCRRRRVAPHDQRDTRDKSHSSFQSKGKGLRERRLNAGKLNALRCRVHRALWREAKSRHDSDSRFPPSHHCGNHSRHDRRGVRTQHPKVSLHQLRLKPTNRALLMWIDR